MTARRQNRFRTWQLWNGLFNPPEHSVVFQRILQSSIPIPHPLQRALPKLRRVWELVAPLVRIIIAVFALIALPLGVNLIGALFAYYTANFISRERERGTYELLALTPAGEWDTAWTISIASVYRFNVLDSINFMRAMAILSTILLIAFTAGGAQEVLVLLISAGIAVQFDAIQTIVVGCLGGMLGQTYSASATNAGTWGMAIFAGAQLVVYIPVTLAYSMTVYVDGLRYRDIGIAAPLFPLVLLFLLHEIVIRVLWANLRYRLH